MIPLPQAFWMGFVDGHVDSLMQGFAEAATPMNLLYAVIGVLLGTRSARPPASNPP